MSVEVTTGYPDASTALGDRLDCDPLDLLAQSRIFGEVPRAELQAIQPPPECIHLEAGEILIRQGDQGEAFYLLIRGRLRVFVTNDDGTRQAVGDVLPGDGVGEMSLLTDQVTAADVRATHDCSLVCLPRAAYLQLMKSAPEAALNVCRMVIERLRLGIGAGPKRLPFPAVALVPIDQGVDVGRFSADLVAALAQHASAVIVTPDLLGTKYAGQLRRAEPLPPRALDEVHAALARHAASNDIVLFAASCGDSAWRRLCVEYATLVLLVATPSGDPEPSADERQLLAERDEELRPRSDLVLLHGRSWTARCGANRWLAPRRVAQVHHLRQGHNDDFARLARVLSGQAIGLLLGGYGAHGLAQIGALKALTEAGVPIDYIGGGGLGALLAAQYALGQSIGEIAEISREIWIDGRPLSDYTFPAVSVIRGRRLQQLIKSALDDWMIEDLPLDFFCVSGNLTDGDLMLHERGPLWAAVGASGSLPGAGPPTLRDGKILVDGGAIVGLPTEAMLERGAGLLIAVDVSDREPLAVPKDLEELPSGWLLLWRRLNPFSKAPALPDVFSILLRTATLSSDRQSRQAHARCNLVIAPPLASFGITEFAGLDALIAIGYGTAVRCLHALDGRNRLARFVDKGALPPPESLPTVADVVAGYRTRRQLQQTRRRRRIAAALAVIVLGAGAWGVMTGVHQRLVAQAQGVWQTVQQALGPRNRLVAAESDEVIPEGGALPVVTRYEGANILPVDTLVLEPSDGYDVLDYVSGRVESRRSSGLGFERPGLVVDVAVEEGQRVAAGDLVARLDVRQLEAERRTLEAELKLKDAARRETEVRYQLALRTAERREKLLENRHVSQQGYDEAALEGEALAARLAADEAAVEEARAQLDGLFVDIARSEIHAPFDGTVVDRRIDEGTTVTTGQAVVRLIEDQVMEVRVGIPVKFADRLSGDEVYEILIGGRTYRARLQSVIPSLDANTRSVPVIFRLEKPTTQVRAEQLARLRITYQVPAEGYWLPATALVGGRRGLWNAYVMEPDEADGELMRAGQRELQLLHSEVDRAYVRGTLQPGEQVIVTGLHRLVPGQLVRAK